MKKTISFILVTLLVFSTCVCLSACSSTSKSAVVGIWKNEQEGHNSYGDYLYVYEDGTGDDYGPWMGEVGHSNSFEWKVEGEYFYRGSTSYVIKGNALYTKQGTLAYTLVQKDTGVDM